MIRQKRLFARFGGKEPPYYVQYDFVVAKGRGNKLSSSTGELITVSEALEVYEPEVLRFLFASRKPNLDFSIAFDLDVMKAYDEFDRAERFAYGIEEEDPRKVAFEKRVYEFSLLEHRRIESDPTRMPPQFPFRHLTSLLQIHEGDFEQVAKCYQDRLRCVHDEQRFFSRARRAWFWIQNYAPEEFRFRLKSQEERGYKTRYPLAIQDIITALESAVTQEDFGEDRISSILFSIMKSHGLSSQDFFPEIYLILIGKTKGPKLASFILTVGPRRIIEILKSSLAG